MCLTQWSTLYYFVGMLIQLRIDIPMLDHPSPISEMAAVKAAAQSRDPAVTGDPPNQEPVEAVVVWTPPTRAKTNANPLEQSSSDPPLMPEMAAVEAAAPSRDPPTLGDPPNQKPGEAIVAWTPTTTPCTLGQSNSNPSLQLVATKRKALDGKVKTFLPTRPLALKRPSPRKPLLFGSHRRRVQRPRETAQRSGSQP